MALRSFPKGLILGTAVICAIGGLMLKSTEPTAHRLPLAGDGNAEVRRAARHMVPRAEVAPVPHRAGARSLAPLVAALPADASWRTDPQVQPAAIDETTGGAAPRRTGGGIVRVRVPVPVPAVPAEKATVERRRSGTHRKLVRQRRQGARRRNQAERTPGPAAEAPEADRPAREAPLAPEPPAAVANAEGDPPDDVTFESPDDVQFPTDVQVAIPVSGKDHRAEGSVSLWVQPGWARGDRDDATLVQLGDKLQLKKADHFLSLEAAADDDPERDAPVSLDTPIADWNPGEWHHVTATWKAEAVSLYVDGELVGRHLGRGHLDLADDTPLLVGSDRAAERRVARGLVDRVDLRERALDDQEVLSAYQGEPADHGPKGASRGDPAGEPDRHGRAHESRRGAAR